MLKEENKFDNKKSFLKIALILSFSLFFFYMEWQQKNILAGVLSGIISIPLLFVISALKKFLFVIMWLIVCVAIFLFIFAGDWPETEIFIFPPMVLITLIIFSIFNNLLKKINTTNDIFKFLLIPFFVTLLILFIMTILAP